jgi:hypothetical protein
MALVELRVDAGVVIRESAGTDCVAPATIADGSTLQIDASMKIDLLHDQGNVDSSICHEKVREAN